MPVLNLKRGSRTRVWLRTLEILQEDATLSDAVNTWVTWHGDHIPQGSDIMPLLRIEPNLGAQGWYSPDAQSGLLTLRVILAVQSRDAEDWLNFWECFENSLYPYAEPQRQLAIQQSLRDAGAETGQWEFSIPLTDPDPRFNEEGIFRCQGSMRITVIRAFNP